MIWVPYASGCLRINPFNNGFCHLSSAQDSEGVQSQEVSDYLSDGAGHLALIGGKSRTQGHAEWSV